MHALTPQIAAAGPYGDRERRLPPDLVAAMAQVGLFRTLLAPTLDGADLSLPEFLLITEVVAQSDGSAGWCLVQGAMSAAQVAPFLSPAAGRHIFADPTTILANGTGANGKAVAVDGGYRLNGEWPFASGCTHATWFKASAVVYGANGDPARLPDGAPEHRSLMFPADAGNIKDIWHVSGLRGTGSNAIVATDVFVPHEHTVSVAHDTLVHCSQFAALPYATTAAAGFCAVAFGLARGAQDAYRQLATGRIARGATNPLREHPVVQSQVARAEAQLRAARAFLYEVTAEAGDTVSRGESLTLEQRAVFRLAATSGIHQAAAVVDSAFTAAGATAIFEHEVFERRFRDVHAITQQVQGHVRHFETVGRVLLGLDTGGGAL